MNLKTIERTLEKNLAEELVRLEEIKNGGENAASLPNHIYVEPTNICNLKCVTCTPPEVKGRAGFISVNMWKDIVNYMKNVGSKPAITMIGRGEPLMHHEIDQLVNFAADKDFPCYLITNGTLLTSQKAEKLIQAGLSRIQFSLHATTSETYEKMTQKPLFETVIENINQFIRINDEAGHPCHVSVFSVVCSINAHEIAEFRKIWQDKVDRVFMHNFFSLHGDSKMADEAEQYIQPDQKIAKGCVMPWTFFTIRWDGAIVPCPLDHASKIVVGNIYNNRGEIDLKAVWNSEVFRKMRKAQAHQDYQTLSEMGYQCRQCEARLNPNTFNEISSYIRNFPRIFALQFVPMLKTISAVKKLEEYCCNTHSEKS